MTVFLYLLMILVWGASWIAIKWQGGEVPTEVSILYRFVIAVVLMFILGKVFNKLQSVKRRDQMYFALQGLCLFSCNFIAFYNATFYIPSGLVAVIMATVPIINAIHGRLIYKTPTNSNFWLSVVIGLSGICLLFGSDLLQTNWSSNVLIGLMYALLGSWFFSMGNMVSIRNTRNNIGPFTATSYAMLYGCAALLIMILIKGLDFTISTDLRYIGSLLYLAVPASIIGFTAYLVLVDRIGANNAAYLLVITPIVALIVSSIFEDYQWTIYSTVGLTLVVFGNVINQWKKTVLRFSSNQRL